MATSPAVDRGGRGRLVPLPSRVVSARAGPADTPALESEPAGDERLADFAPGQFAMLYAFGAGEAPISVSAHDPSSGRVTHTIRAVGAVSSALCATAPGRQ